MERTTKLRLGIVLGVLAAAAGLVWLAQNSTPAGPLRLRMTVGRDTTFLTTPLTADGRVDYAAAWSAEQSAGVTPENNGAPLVYAALGRDLSRFTEAERDRMARIEPHFTDFRSWAYKHEDLLPRSSYATDTDSSFTDRAIRAFDACEDDGEDAGDDPGSIWLEEVRSSLDAVVRAMAMGRFFTPCVSPLLEPGTESTSFDLPLESGICEALAWRALKRARRGDMDGAGADFRAALQYVTHLRSLGNWLQFSGAVSGERDVWRRVRQLQSSGSSVVDPAALESLLAALRAVRDPTLPAERLSELFRASRIKLLAHFDSALQSVEETCAKDGVVQNRGSFDPDRIAVLMNRRYDEFDAALAAGTWPEQRRRLDKLFDDMKITNSDVATRFALKAVGWPGGPRLDEVPWDLMLMVEASSMRDAAEDFAACTAEGDLALVELAALVFALENGRDPSSSDDLTPDLVDVPWRDRITGSRVTFRRDADDHLVAQGEVVDFLEALDLEREEPASEKK